MKRIALVTVAFLSLMARGDASAPTASFGITVSAASTVPTITAVQADSIAAAAANVNTGFCSNGHNEGSTTQTYAGSTPDALPVAYLKMELWRGVRESGTLSECYNESTFFGFQNSLYSTQGIDLIGASSTAYTTAQIASAKTTLHGLRAIEFGNEWDVHGFAGTLAAAASAGATQITTNFQSLLSNMVPGSTYSVAGTGGTDTFTFVSPVSNQVGNISPALTYPVASGATITRVSTATQDILDWYAYYPSIIHANQATFPILGPSFAAPIFGQTNFASGGYVPNVQIMEKHDYPIQGYNPEGPAGDGSTSVSGVNHPPCSIGNTSYSIQFDNCAIENAVGATSKSAYKAMETTEWSYEIVPDGSAQISGSTAAIPDQIGIHYVLRGEAMQNNLGTERVYYEGMSDCIDAPPSGFATYGLHTGGVACTGMPSGTFAPKATELALRSYISAWTDSGCKFGTCYLTPSPNIKVGWSDASLPLNHQYGQFANGQVQIGFWLGANEYNPTATTGCQTTSSCTTLATPRSEMVSIPGATSVQLWHIDDTPTDPTPAPTNPTAPDGTVESGLVLCPLPYASTPTYGCWTVTSLPITNGTVSVSATGDYQMLRATISGLTSPVPTTSPTPMPSPYTSG